MRSILSLVLVHVIDEHLYDQRFGLSACPVYSRGGCRVYDVRLPSAVRCDTVQCSAAWVGLFTKRVRGGDGDTLTPLQSTNANIPVALGWWIYKHHCGIVW